MVSSVYHGKQIPYNQTAVIHEASEDITTRQVNLIHKEQYRGEIVILFTTSDHPLSCKQAVAVESTLWSTNVTTGYSN